MLKEITQNIPVRYTVLGTIDGVIACLAIVIGVFSANVESNVIVAAGLSGGIGLSISNGIGGLMAEYTVEHRRMRTIEEAMMVKSGSMKGTLVHKGIQKKLIYDTITHGGCSLLGAMLPILPFVFLDIQTAIVVSIVLSFMTLFLLGVYMGAMTKEMLVIAGMKMLLVGILAAVVVRLLGLH